MNDRDTPPISWNKQEKKNNLPLYILIGAVCFALAWVMSGAMK